jgi:flagellar L-ring protein precursor FlgH
MNTKRFRYLVLLLTALGGLGRSAAPAAAQSSSLMGNPDQRRPLSLGDVSWTYLAPEPKREIHVNDLITVNVNELATVISGGSINQRLQGERNWNLKNWIIPTSSGIGVKPDPMTAGSPAIDFLINNTYQANADLQSKEAVKFKLACHVVDIRPNGTLVLEGRRTIAVNEMNWEVSLVGSIRADDVGPNNIVSSENVADMRLVKRETGQVRDGYKRGWVTQWLDTYNPF